MMKLIMINLFETFDSSFNHYLSFKLIIHISHCYCPIKNFLINSITNFILPLKYY